jgi:DNA replication and repair protein RecF
MFIKSLELKNFRCFTGKTFNFNNRIVVFEGINGSGKTSVLEALHYACYLKSFKTNRSAELVKLGADCFFIEIDFDELENQVSHCIQAGFQNKNKLVKLNKKSIKSYKDIVAYYRIIGISEDDIQLVQGAPEYRRLFLNQALMIFYNDFVSQFKEYKKILEQRNSILFQNNVLTKSKRDELFIWTKQLWECSREIQKQRISFLKEIEETVNDLLDKYFSPSDLRVALEYRPKNTKSKESFDVFWERYQEKVSDELKWNRSLFGIHLDDFTISFQNKKARVYASRGQQKLIVFLLKIAQFLKLKSNGLAAVILLDDFLTDFDDKRFSDCCKILQDLSAQIFLTVPLKSFFKKKNDYFSKNVQLISL